MKSNQEDFDNKITKIWDYPVLDGIVNQKRFASNKTKILWILKEPDKLNSTETWDHRDFHHNVSCYNKWRATYQKIIYVSYGILNNVTNYWNLPEIDKNAKINGVNILEDIALINLNKSGGGSVSNPTQIFNSYHNNKEFHLEHINWINSDLIINASRVWDIFNDLSCDKIVSLRKTNLQYSTNGKKLVVNTYHPNARFNEEVYCNSIFHAYKKMKEKA